jgi:hypothetical protein
MKLCLTGLLVFWGADATRGLPMSALRPILRPRPVGAGSGQKSRLPSRPVDLAVGDDPVDRLRPSDGQNRRTRTHLSGDWRRHRPPTGIHCKVPCHAIRWINPAIGISLRSNLKRLNVLVVQNHRVVVWQLFSFVFNYRQLLVPFIRQVNIILIKLFWSFKNVGVFIDFKVRHRWLSIDS